MPILKKEFLERIIAQSKREFPNECCGIMAGKNGEIYKVYEMINIDKSPSTFFMETRAQLMVMKEIRAQGLELLGIYHSHVASPAYPSAHDVDMAFYPEVSYVIVSLKDNPVIRSFKIKEGNISEEEIRIIDT